MNTSVRLIYLDPGFKYPSSWLVYLHVMKWNHFRSFKEIRALLEVGKSDSRAMNRWWDGGEIPHWKVEDACGLKRNHLKYSFLEGWFPSPKPWECVSLEMRPRMRIRHCPQCIKFGYHSAVFFFEHITHCPWHREKLEYCKHCSDVLENDWRPRKGMATVSEQCEHLGVILDALPSAAIPEGFVSDEVAWCNEHRDWIQCAVGLIGHAAYEVLVQVPHDIFDRRVVVKFLADHLWPPDFAYKLDAKISMLKLPVSKLSWEIPYHHELHGGKMHSQKNAIRASQPQASPAEAATMAKSVRRYIFRRYLRLHRKCLARLSKVGLDQWHTFNLEGICPCVMAYLIAFSRYWGCSPFDFLHSKLSCAQSHAARFIKVGDTLKCENYLLMHNLLGDFYRHWSILRNYSQNDFETFLLSYRYDGDHFGVVPPMTYETALMYRQYFYWDVYLFMEDPACAHMASIPDCVKRRSVPLTVQLDEFLDSTLANNQNTLCAFHNPSNTNGRRCHI